VRQGESTFGHHLHEIMKAEFVAQIPAHAEDDYFAIEMAAFEEFVHQPKGSSMAFRPLLQFVERWPVSSSADRDAFADRRGKARCFSSTRPAPHENPRGTSSMGSVA
jgi:hypothetical protein